MEELKTLLQDILNENLLWGVLSGQRKKEGPVKIKIRPLLKKGRLIFQAALWDGKKEFHINYEKEEMIQAVLAWMSRDFKQFQGETSNGQVHVLVSKKGKVTVRQKETCGCGRKPELSHNRKKNYLLEEGTPIPYLVKLGVMTKEGKVIKEKYDKFRQINRFLEFIQDVCTEFPQGQEISILDFGCGKSYLTFAVYDYLCNRRGYKVNITGLDLKEDVIARCSQLAEECGYENLHFLTGDIADYENTRKIDLVITLHACDTATDYALAKAVEWGAKVILSVPCCQHELNGRIQCEILSPVLKYGLLKERMAALITDGLRASLLEEAGYRVQVMEFIDMEHTPKNILIRAVKGKKDEKEGERKALSDCMEFLSVKPSLSRLLKGGVADGQ